MRYFIGVILSYYILGICFLGLEGCLFYDVVNIDIIGQ